MSSVPADCEPLVVVHAMNASTCCCFFFRHSQNHLTRPQSKCIFVTAETRKPLVVCGSSLNRSDIQQHIAVKFLPIFNFVNYYWICKNDQKKLHLPVQQSWEFYADILLELYFYNSLLLLSFPQIKYNLYIGLGIVCDLNWFDDFSSISL